jgi:membrane protease YdiL (CAAX protease family)
MKYIGFFLKNKRVAYSVPFLIASILYAYYGCFASMGLLDGRLSFLTHFLGLDEGVPYGFAVLLLLLLLFILADREGETNPLGITFQWRDLSNSLSLFVKVYFFSCLFALVLGGVFFILTRKLDAFQETRQLNSLVSVLTSTPLSLGVLWVFLNAVFEETIFRAFLMNELNFFIRRGHVVVFLSALIQAGYHLYQGWFRCLIVFFLFLFFSSYYQKNKRLTPVILAHFYVDAFSLIMVKAFSSFAGIQKG